MNYLSTEILEKARVETIYNLYLYLLDKYLPLENETFESIAGNIHSNTKINFTPKDLYRLEIIKNAVKTWPFIAKSRISNITNSERGLKACAFTKPDKSVSVVFCGTGSGEWIDNGEGLSGIPEKNTYLTYDANGNVSYFELRERDYATDQQVEALNWFNQIALKSGWNEGSKITVSGHSKGGNKAQFIAIHSELISDCFSFSGQGFSPEALIAFKNMFGSKFGERCQHIYSFSAENDYVNVLGSRLVLKNNIYYFKSKAGIHFLEAIIDENGNYRPQTEQGKLSLFVENVSDELMNMTPALRQYAALGVMNIFQKHLGEGTPINGDSVSIEETIAGIGIAVGSLLHQLYKNKNLWR